MKDLFQLMRDRESCRAYDAGRQIDRELLLQCVQAAGLAPSARNAQPWKFVVVQNPDLCRAMAEAVQEEGLNRFAGQCSAFVVVQELPGPDSSERGRRFVRHDIGLAVMQMCLAAEALGLATCIMGSFGRETVSRLLHLPEEEPPYLVVAFGYAASEQRRPKKRKAPEEYITYLG